MWDWLINFMASILAGIESFCGDWGLAVIILTVIIRIIIMPLMNKQVESSARMQVAQPKIQELQERYADNPEKQAEELRKIYADLKVNPVMGCLPVLIQMPIFFALFTVARYHVPEDASFFNIIPSLSQSAAGGLEGGWAAGAPYVIAALLFGLLTFLQMALNLKNSTTSEQKQQQLIMGIVMAVMMVWFSWNIPSAAVLYYNASAIWGILQQQLVTKHVIEEAKKKAEYEATHKPVQVDVVRKAKKPRPHKKS
ncbi:MAG: YidC/Oxa1 family membrane protein insertase [Tractidigestivibacter sp.]|jgi:YidC/Oxa1 family membrane protein insertase|uniref:YidC/Oxa1 family membrane protein insertase n=1 Tax=Tractidigestivibacter sp. TaxID=2847320 RepID=UPI003D8E437F